ncbi:MAG: hypothetical protein K6D03_06125 [Solobacterium sp.]|nr:hypothetical protein [Solobacterium sp.]
MNKTVFAVLTAFVMIAVSRFIIRIVDATVQIDDDIGVLLLLTAAVNVLIIAAGRRLYIRLNSRDISSGKNPHA